MDQALQNVVLVKSALFVDFDNIYIGLSKTDPQAAERFASDPSRWLAWLEQGLPAQTDSRPRARSILIRRCYPNPDAGFRRFRSFFTSAAFSVTDCPTLTRTGKNSADIYMVMDILDALSHKTYFDEFIIFSGDSDFLPVLLRLRAHDRRTTTLAIDFMPPAYKAACDLVIGEEEFIEDALGLAHEVGNCANGFSRARVPVVQLKEMAIRVYEAACDDGEVAGADLPDILKDFRSFRESNNWLGFGTSQRLAEALICYETRLQLVRVNPLMYKLVLKPQVISTPRLPREKSVPADLALAEKVAPDEKMHVGEDGAEKPARADKPTAPEKLNKTDLSRLRAQVITLVREMVTNSRGAVLLARASQYVVSKMGPQVLETQWAGAGSFKRLLQNSNDLGLEITTQPEPGYIFDPRRHTHPSKRGQATAMAASLPNEGSESAGETPLAQEAVGAPDSTEPEAYMDDEQPEPYEGDEEEEEEEPEAYEESLPSLDEFIRRAAQVTGAPDLTSEQYALVFHGIIEELQQIAEGQKSYNTYQSSKAVSDWCAARGANISHSSVVLIFKGIIFQDGVRFSKRPGSYTAQELALGMRNNIKALCRRSRMELSEYEERLLDEWILGALEDELAGEPEEAPAEGLPPANMAEAGDSAAQTPADGEVETHEPEERA